MRRIVKARVTQFWHVPHQSAIHGFVGVVNVPDAVVQSLNMYYGFIGLIIDDVLCEDPVKGMLVHDGDDGHDAAHHLLEFLARDGHYQIRDQGFADVVVEPDKIAHTFVVCDTCSRVRQRVNGHPVAQLLELGD